MKGHARQFMTTKVVVTTRQTSLAEAARELARLEVSGLPVVDADGQVLGIVTESDVLNALLEETPVESPVQVVMKTPVVTVDEFTPGGHRYSSAADVSSASFASDSPRRGGRTHYASGSYSLFRYE